MAFPNSNFEGKLALMFLASHFDIIESWKLIVEHRDIYYAKKILNFFVCVEGKILVEGEIYIRFTFYTGHYDAHGDWKRLLYV